MERISNVDNFAHTRIYVRRTKHKYTEITSKNTKQTRILHYYFLENLIKTATLQAHHMSAFSV